MISKEDLNYINKIYQEYLAVAKTFDKTISTINGVYDEKVHQATGLKGKSAHLSLMRFNSKINEIRNFIVDLNNDFISKIEYYISNKYNLGHFDSFELSERTIKLLKVDPLISPELIINNIIKQVGNVVESGLENIKKCIRDLPMESSKNTIVFHKTFYLHRRSFISVSNHNNINSIFRLLSLVEFGDIELKNRFTQIEFGKLNTHYPYTFFFNKLKAIRFYKNGKMVVYFTEEKYREEFESYLK